MSFTCGYKYDFCTIEINSFLLKKLLQVVKEYEERRREIRKLEKNITQQEQELAKHKEDIEKIKKEWLEPLKELIKQISNNFRNFFRMLKCAGEVELAVPENPVIYFIYLYNCYMLHFVKFNYTNND